MDRGVGYCENINCEDFSKGVFILDIVSPFVCPRCGHTGWVEQEKYEKRLLIPEPVLIVYKTVRVNFNFNPTNKKYLSIAIVSIDELKIGGEYEIWSPLIKTEKRALKVAEVKLCALNSGLQVDDRFSDGIVLNYGESNWTEQLKVLQEVLIEREKRIAYALGRN